MLEIIATPVGQVVIYLWALAILGVAGWWIISSLRGRSGEDTLDANDMLTNFGEMHRQGDISDLEFRKIKTRLSDDLKSEVSNVVE